MLAAHKKGWRTFRTRNIAESIDSSEFICPASKEGGVRTNCVNCGLCAGTAKQAKSPIIAYH